MVKFRFSPFGETLSVSRTENTRERKTSVLPDSFQIK
jgi:hypothetical protein